MMECSKLLIEALDNWVPKVDSTLVVDLNEGQKRSLAYAIQDFKDNKRTFKFYRLNKDTKQALVNTLFSSRDLSKVKGNVMAKSDVDYFGFTTSMSPDSYLRLALKRTEGTFNREKAKDFVNNILQEVVDGKKPRLGTPLLIVSFDDAGRLVVRGHEGRHRANAIYELLGKDVDLPVDIKFTDEIRRRHLDASVMEKELVNQNGRALGITLKDLLGNKEIEKNIDSMISTGPTGTGKEITTSRFLKDGKNKGVDISNKYWEGLPKKYLGTSKISESDLYYTQDAVYPETLKNKLNNPTDIIAIKEGDKYYIVDGHHSYISHKLKGETPSIKVYSLHK